jgi:CheY-like chemotaxis protein
VFDPFFTTKRGANGTGLGLSQVHGFAHQSGGTVTIASEIGRGTTITLYLPRADQLPEQAAAAPDRESLGGGTVLLVEDNPEVAEVTAALLAQLGYRVEQAGNAQKGLDALERREFDLVVSDIMMAGEIDGLGLARAVRQRHPRLPVVLVTGYSETATAAGSEFPVLRKPYRLADLSRTIAKAIGDAAPPPSNLVRLEDARRRP